MIVYDCFYHDMRGRSMKTKYILFDIDGLMVDSEKLSFSLIREIVREHGFDLSLDFYRQTIGINQKTGARLFSEAYPGIDGQRDIYDAFTPRYEAAVKQGGLEPKPGLFELLDELDRRSIRRAAASSNVKRVVMANLTSIGALSRMDAIVCDGMVKRVKPFPDLFLKAAELLGASPAECLVLEDSTAGVQAAHAAQMPVIVIPDLIEPTADTLSLCLGQMDSLLDVRDYIMREDIRG